MHILRPLAALAAILAPFSSPAHAHPPGVLPGETYHVIFATSTTHGITSNTSVPPLFFPDFGGLNAADYIVTEAAFNATGLSGGGQPGPPPLGIPANAWMGAPPDAEQPWDGVAHTWTAILSTATVNANARVAIVGPVYNTAGQLVAVSHADFFDGQLENAVGYNEFGELIDGLVNGEFAGAPVWTGSFSDGTRTAERCTNWTSNSSALAGSIGFSGRAVNPLEAGSRNCNQSVRLYALGPAITVPYPADFTGDGPVDAADLAHWSIAFGQTADADADLDNDSDGADFLIWQQQFGGGAEPALTIPEPSGAALAGAALAAGAVAYRKR